MSIDDLISKAVTARNEAAHQARIRVNDAIEHPERFGCRRGNGSSNDLLPGKTFYFLRPYYDLITEAVKFPEKPVVPFTTYTVARWDLVKGIIVLIVTNMDDTSAASGTWRLSDLQHQPSLLVPVATEKTS